jgi:hypothetical protein
MIIPSAIHISLLDEHSDGASSTTQITSEIAEGELQAIVLKTFNKAMEKFNSKIQAKRRRSAEIERQQVSMWDIPGRS